MGLQELPILLREAQPFQLSQTDLYAFAISHLPQAYLPKEIKKWVAVGLVLDRFRVV